MPQPPDIYVIIGKFLSGTIEEDEQQYLEAWRQECPDEFTRLQQLWNESAKPDSCYRQEYNQQKLNQRIDAWEAGEEDKKVRHSLRPWLVAASISLLLIGSVITFFYDNLSEAFRAENREWVEKRSVRSQIATFTLIDGTKVKLNADSKLRYAENFVQAERREVFLEGEAYFEVTHRPDRPFLVRTSEVDVRVLGTSFSVNAYPEDTLTGVVVANGKVAVNGLSTQSPEVVLPNQKVTYYKSSRQWKKTAVDVTQELAWTEGKLLFQNADLKQVAKTLERYYDITISFNDKMLESCRFTGSFQRETLFNVLDAIGYINNLEYEYENGTVVLSGAGCTP